MYIYIQFCEHKEYKARNIKVPQKLVDHKPLESADELCLYAARYYQTNRKEKDMFEALKRLRSREKKVDFLLEYDYLNQAEPIMKELGQ